MKNSNIIWYNLPANDWLEALPIGNGHLGAMVFGNPSRQRIQLNDDTLYAGKNIDNNPKEALSYLPEIRKLLLDGKNIEALELAQKYLQGDPQSVRSYQSLCDVYVEFDNRENINEYRRELDMSSGIVNEMYKSNGVNYINEYFISADYDVMVMRFSSDRPNAISGNITAERIQDAVTQACGQNSLSLLGQIIDADHEQEGPGGENMRFGLKLSVQNFGGTVMTEKDKVFFKDSDEVIVLLTSTTDYDLNSLSFDRNKDISEYCDEKLAVALRKSFKDLKDAHIKEFSRLYERVRLSISSDNSDIPMNKRLEAVASGEEDLSMVEYLFNYGRYLLISSSRRPGTLPANLQGIWADGMKCAWNADFHTNINLQMNYWLAEVTNLSETTEPLFNFMQKLTVPGAATAQKMYGARGWTVHHLTDAFGKTSVHDGINYGMFPMGGPWMCLHLWEHYEYSRDMDFLQNIAYPMIKGSSQFVLDFLVTDKKGQLVTCPSYSPENSFKLPDGSVTKLTYAPTMDVQIINMLFSAFIKAANLLGIDANLVKQAEEALSKLPPMKISPRGTIQEWVEDYEEVEPGHRHLSHLFGLHPGNMITKYNDLELFKAARKTIEYRLSHAAAGMGYSTGWGRAWTIMFFARLKMGDTSYEYIQEFMAKFLTSNLFDLIAAKVRIFQIEGNFGFTAAVAEMLLQSHEIKSCDRIISILPALPSAWKCGNVKGLKARGNFEIDIFWDYSKLTAVKILSLSGEYCRLELGTIVGIKVTDHLGNNVDIITSGEIIEFATEKNRTYIIEYN